MTEPLSDDDLKQMVSSISNFESFNKFVNLLWWDLLDNTGNWTNITVEQYLAAIATYTDKQVTDEELTWQTLGEILLAARGTSSGHTKFQSDEGDQKAIDRYRKIYRP